jgi:hypothetical protein
MELKKNMNSDFDDFLKEDGIYKEVDDFAIKKVVAYKIEKERGVHFEIKIPNETTRKAIVETRARINTEEMSFEDFKKELNEITH